MILSFSQKINNKPTYFAEKILRGLRDIEVDKHIATFFNSEFYTPGKFIEVNPKIHTIREDKKNRWKAGINIHFVINRRTPKQLQFAPAIKCESVQDIEIIPETKTILIDQSDSSAYMLTKEGLKNLIVNDGFDSEEDFWNYFNEPFEGKIIHWTKLRY